ncbi:MAG: two-component system, NtrC family, sensor histidine kinase KinB [Actinomycetota bacterium]|jgi:signal transduction histidine kinase|nr:two-component system, NtrC family, sensor histidine kinase KinB [Actinomycetota bacterium]
MTTARSPLMARLVEIVSGFGAMVDVPELLQRITEEGHELLSAYGVAIAVRNGDQLTLAAGTSPHPELVGRSFPVANSAVEILINSGRRSFSVPGGSREHLNPELRQLSKEIYATAEPMPFSVALTRSKPDSAGALYVLRDEPLNEDELEALELLAAHAGAALHTAEVFASEKQLEAAKDLFLATASHELRTPLTVLRGFAETLLNHWDALDDAGRRELVETIRVRTEGMTGLVEQILLGSRAGLGVDAKLRPFDLAAAVRTAGAAIAGSSENHPLVVDAPGELLVVGDEGTIDGILGQLVENSVKYSPDGGRIDVTLRTDGEAAVLSVADLGVGIPAGDLTRVFQRFARSEQGAGGQRTAGGAGLGLYIVKRYVEAQQGRVAALAREGGGTVIEVRLPLA